MSIGQALAEARRQAGLTVADVSQRTRIREGIIRGIEAEDFSVCGGDFYARGHIRSIAKVVGADPVPLVAEYDQVWRERGGNTDVRHVMDLITESRTAPPVEPAAGPLAEADTGPLAKPVTAPETGPVTDPGAGPVTDQEAGPVTNPGAEPVTDPGAGPVIGPPAAPGPMGEQGARPPGQPGAWPPHQPSPHQPSPHQPSPHQPSPHQPSPHQPDTGTLGGSVRWGTSGPPPWRTPGPGQHSPGSAPPHRRLNWTAVLAVAVVIAFGLIGYELMSGGGQSPPAAAPAASSGTATQHPAEHGSGTPVPQRTRQTSASAPSPTPTPPRATASAPPAASKSLTPASATAFGPGGSGQGDNTDLAHLAVDSSPGTAWHTDWYTSASFGNLYSGTGLLVDLGHPATITGARITLGGAPGAAFELRAGPSPSALRTVARAHGVSGLVTLRLSSPVQGRYLLIWFTRLPDAAGSYEASVHDVKVTIRS